MSASPTLPLPPPPSPVISSYYHSFRIPKTGRESTAAETIRRAQSNLYVHRYHRERERERGDGGVIEGGILWQVNNLSIITIKFIIKLCLCAADTCKLLLAVSVRAKQRERRREGEREAGMWNLLEMSA